MIVIYSMFVLTVFIFMPRRQTIESFGYEPNPSLARAQIKSLLPGLNRTRITTALAARPNQDRTIRLPQSKKQRALRRLVEAWQASGPNLAKLFAQNPELELRTKHGATLFYPTKAGRGHLDWAPSPVAGRHSPEREALEDFMTLIANPRWELLGGPCARCGDYFVKHTKRQKVYCSRTCSSAATAFPQSRENVKKSKPERFDLPNSAYRVGQDQATIGMETMGLKRDWIHNSVAQSSCK